ncbi:MAG: lysophospholipid acyltransferase family protein [Candidatus Aminicenantales bacterium]
MKRIFDHLRSALIWILVLPVFAVCCLLILGTALVYRGPGLDRLMKGSCRLILACCGIRIRLRGLENFAPDRPCIVMMNHVNFLDPFVFYARFPGRARAIEEESHFRWPLYGPMIRRVGMIPISRQDPERARQSLRQAAGLARERPDLAIVILPEGTRTRDGELGPFKRGGFLLALETGREILPIVQKGAFRINRKGSRLIRPGRIDLVILPPVPTSGYTRETVDSLADRTRSLFLTSLGA